MMLLIVFVRYTQPPGDLWDWYESFLDDEEVISLIVHVIFNKFTNKLLNLNQYSDFFLIYYFKFKFFKKH